MKVLSLSLWLLLLRLLEISSWGQNYLRGKYREWIEDNDRVEVRSWYAETEVELKQGWSLDFLGTIDAWSGATPNGLPPRHSSSTLPWLSNVPEEIRKAGLFTLNKAQFPLSLSAARAIDPCHRATGFGRFASPALPLVAALH